MCVGDIALQWLSGDADLLRRADDLASEEGLRTAMLLSLFTDRLAEEDDVLPAGDGDRRGWWGDELAAVEGDRFGSRLWLLDRSKRREDVVPLAEEYIREALAWMLEDKVTQRLDVEVETGEQELLFAVTVQRPEGDPVTFRFAHVWQPEPSPPAAAFSFGFSGLEVSFTDLSESEARPLVLWLWDFGDGETSTQRNPVHTYAVVGTYLVTLTVTNTNGDMATASRSVETPPLFLWDSGPGWDLGVWS